MIGKLTAGGEPIYIDAGVTDVKVDGTSVVTNKVANIDLTGKQDKLTVNPTTTTSTLTGLIIDGVSYQITGGSGGGVTSVNGKTGAVVLTASDVNALPDTTVIPTKTSELTNDSGFLTEHQSLSEYRKSTDQDAIDTELGNRITTIEGKESGWDARLTDVKVNGTSVVSGTEASIPLATIDNAGVVKIDNTLNYSQSVDCIGINSNGKLILPIQRTDLDQYGVSKKLYGSQVYNGTPRLLPAEPSIYPNRDESASLSSASDYNNKPIVPNTMDRAVKAALTDGKGTAYTDTEKNAARARIDAQQTLTVGTGITMTGTTLSANLQATYDSTTGVLSFTNN